MSRALLRSASIAFCSLTAAYALLCASAFTFHDFIRSDMFRVASFATWHARLYWAWWAVAVLDMRIAAAGRRTAWWTFGLVWAAVGAYVAGVHSVPRQLLF